MTGAKSVVLSLNEVEQLCLKAARGAGMAWGLAEEAGFAAKWLAERGLDGPKALLRLVEMDASAAPPVMAPGHWREAGGGSLCPILTGAALGDFALLPDAAMGTAGLKIGPLRQVLLLLPFAWVFGAIHGKAAQVTLPGGSVLLQPTGAVSGDVGRFAATALATVAITLQPAGAEGPALVPAPCAVLPQTLVGLNRFALRTTVPPSATSRAGAGAEVDDND